MLGNVNNLGLSKNQVYPFYAHLLIIIFPLKKATFGVGGGGHQNSCYSHSQNHLFSNAYTIYLGKLSYFKNLN